MKLKTQIQPNTTNHYEFDDIDLQLLELLNHDVRKSYKWLAKKINVDPVTVKRRIKKLIGQGIIRLGVMIDHTKIGTPIMVLFALTAELGSLNTVLKEICNLPQFGSVSSVCGRYDITALGRFSSNEEIIEFIHKDLNKIQGLKSSETFIILQRNKGVFSPLEQEDIEIDFLKKKSDVHSRPESSQRRKSRRQNVRSGIGWI